MFQSLSMIRLTFSTFPFIEHYLIDFSELHGEVCYQIFQSLEDTYTLIQGNIISLITLVLTKQHPGCCINLPGVSIEVHLIYIASKHSHDLEEQQLI